MLRPSGELDASAAGDLRSAFGDLADGGDVVIDLSDVGFMDSAGLGALIGGVRRVREAGGSVVACCANDTVARVLLTTGFDRVAPMVGSLDDARRRLEDQGD